MKPLKTLMLTSCLIACGAPAPTPTPNPTPLRPGVKDSSKVYQGTPSPAESAFWDAVRSGDDAARATAVSQMKSDVQADATNGYSEFLIGANEFMPPVDLLRAMASGTAPPMQMPVNGQEAASFLAPGMQNLTDPLYLGFDAAFLGVLQMQSGDTAKGQMTFTLAQMKNPAASGFINVIRSLIGQDLPGALASAYTLLEFCNGGPIDRTGMDAAAWVAKANATSLAHRECYSGFHAMHGTEGLLLLTGDLHAMNGNNDAAGRYYAAAKSATNYSTWPLKPLLERRVSGMQPPSPEQMLGVTACGTCHTKSLP